MTTEIPVKWMTESELMDLRRDLGPVRFNAIQLRAVENAAITKHPAYQGCVGEMDGVIIKRIVADR